MTELDNFVSMLIKSHIHYKRDANGSTVLIALIGNNSICTFIFLIETGCLFKITFDDY
jgi:hypothetical protein